MRSVLVPLDGSEFAEAAVEPTLALAARLGASVTLASVVQDPGSPTPAVRDADAAADLLEAEEAARREYLDQARERIRARHAELEVQVRVGKGPVARALSDAANATGAGLIVMTTHGRGAWQRAWLGSVADALLRVADRPILLLREGDASHRLFADERSPRHVLVPLDGSSDAEEVLGPLAAILPDEGARVTLLRVLHRPFPLAVTYLPHAIEEEAVTAEQRMRARDELRGLAVRWAPRGVEVEVEVAAADDVANEILARSAEGVDLIALTTRGRGGAGRLLLGSVADKVLRGTRLPALAARRRDRLA